MSAAPHAGSGKITVPGIFSRKSRLNFSSPEINKKITCLTAYDYPTARLVDEAGVDIILVGDSVGMVVLGYDSTLPVTIDEMLHHVRAVRRGTQRALLVADMPYGSYHVSLEDSVRNAMRLIKEGGAEAVKVEGGERRIELIARLVEAEIPVMGHVGLTPQSMNALGGFQVQGKTADAARQVERDAQAVEAAGAFALVLESMPRELAASLTEKLRIPTIGIGAGPDCDGQVLVFHDLVGLTMGHTPKFARPYANLSAEVSRAVAQYCEDVRSGGFPSDAESFTQPPVLASASGCHCGSVFPPKNFHQACGPKGACGMNVEDIRSLYEFNYWANHRTLEACAVLTPEQFTRDLGSSFRSVRDTLVHIFGAEWIWLERWHGRETKGLPDASAYPDFESVRRRWAGIEADMLSYVSTLTPESLERIIRYKTIAGSPQEGPHWPMLQHLVNHGSYHRGQIATILRQLGAKPVSTDMIGFYREKAAKSSA